MSAASSSAWPVPRRAYLTFYDRFFEDILNGRKTITIRSKKSNDADALPVCGAVMDVHSNETGIWKCKIRIKGVHTLLFSELNEVHAAQENMTLGELQELIQQIYPGHDEFWLIDFELFCG
jgi:uncharacterized protein YqfB (UPF0267 family)